MLGAVKTSARDASTAEKRSARLRVLTAPARGAGLGIYVTAGVEWLTLTTDFVREYSANISLVSDLTPPPHRPMWSP